VQVWVEHGRVQVSDSSRILQELTKDRRLKWNRLDGNFSLDSLAWGQALAWQKGILLLEAASFTELAFQLKELYGVELITSNAAIRHLHYDAKFFIQTPVENIVATLAEVHGIRYKKQGKIITFY
jgi:ferric-dicitrate binding protein FerR (iron transport regulator)